MLKDKYCSVSEKDKAENKEKKVISNDAFALADIIETKLEHLRISWRQ